jgi:hypothetical protein
MNRLESGKNTARGEKTVDARDQAADRQRLRAPRLEVHKTSVQPDRTIQVPDCHSFDTMYRKIAAVST